MKISARNMLPGKVKKVTKGAVNSEIIIEVAPSLEVVSIITNASVARLGLKRGLPVHAVIKSSDVMVAVE